MPYDNYSDSHEVKQ